MQDQVKNGTGKQYFTKALGIMGQHSIKFSEKGEESGLQNSTQDLKIIRNSQL